MRRLDLRGIFDNLRVQWRDRGKNTSKGNVNICCPFCRDDYGFHMAVSEDREGAYYCYRRPREHSGRHFVRVLIKLGCSRTEAIRLMDNFAGRSVQLVEKEIVAATEQERAWDRFLPIAEGGPAYQRYLREERGFPDPIAVADAYDLRYARLGRWMGRVLFPLREVDGSLGGWTGRAISKSAELRYLTEHGNRDGTIYLPRPGRHSMFIVEGPMDALKGAAATEDLPIGLLALTGKQLNNERLARVAAACARSAFIYLALDADTIFAERSRMLAEIRGACRQAEVKSVKIPSFAKDLGELSLSDARDWLGGIAS